MPATTPITIEALAKLPLEQRIQLAQKLWESVVTEVEQQPIPEWHKKILDERLAAYKADPTAGYSHEEFEARWRARKKR